VPSSYTPEVLRLLRAHGCHHLRDGRHPIWYSPITRCAFPVPSRIKSRHTANEIMKQAGIDHRF
jgi:hypothetical protein